MIQILPHENTIYLADSINAPYGKKTREEIILLSEKNTEFLLNKGCKMIVVACNTATTNAISHLREKYKIPFIGIEPAIKPAALHTKTNNVGILATQGTLSSELFAITSQEFASNIDVCEQEGKGLVELIESNQLESNDMQNLLVKYLEPMQKANIDYLILGCTHYSYLIPQIKEIIGNKVTIIDSGFAVSKQIKKILEKNKGLNSQNRQGNYQFYSNKNIEIIHSLLAEIPFELEIKQEQF